MMASLLLQLKRAGALSAPTLSGLIPMAPQFRSFYRNSMEARSPMQPGRCAVVPERAVAFVQRGSDALPQLLRVRTRRGLVAGQGGQLGGRTRRGPHPHGLEGPVHGALV